MNLFAATNFLLSATCFLLALLIFFYSKRKLHRLWGLFNVSVGVYGFGMFLVGITEIYDQAFWGWRIALFGVANIGMFFYFFVYDFCRLINKKTLYLVCVHGLLFSGLAIATGWIVNELRYAFNQFYYCVAGIGWNVFFSLWIIIVVNAFVNLYHYVKRSKGVRLTQGKYLFWGMLLGFLGGSTASLPSWGIDIYPIWHFFICIYAAISTYAIFRYQLLDIRIVVTRVGVFIAVYSIVLGIPFALAFGLQEKLMSIFGQGWWVVPLIVMTILATAGPFIFLYIQKKAEDRLLHEQRRYQMTLRQAALGMGRIKELKKLLGLITLIVTRTVKLEHSMVFLIDSATQKYHLGAVRSRGKKPKVPEEIGPESLIVKQFLESQNPVVYDEINQKAMDYKDSRLVGLAEELKTFDAAVIVPSFVEDKLLAFIIMGKKISGKLYSEDDLAVFAILASQAALAIENAQFYEDTRKTHEQLFKAEKMATIGTMADGLSHQINNRLHALGFIAGDALDTVKMKRNLPMSDELKEVMVDIEHALTRIQDNVAQGGEIVQGLLKYTRKGEGGFTEIELDRLIDAALEMTQFKIKAGSMAVLREYGADTPKIHGNFTQLQEVFFNLIDNAYDAMMQRRDELKDPDYQPTIRISTRYEDNGYLDIFLKDNGIGIKKEDSNKLFTPFFTTKLSSKKGTGLGLYVIRKLIEESHEGKVSYESVYEQGTTVHLCLPAC